VFYTLHSIDWQVRRLVAVSNYIISAVGHLCADLCVTVEWVCMVV